MSYLIFFGIFLVSTWIWIYYRISREKPHEPSSYNVPLPGIGDESFLEKIASYLRWSIWWFDHPEAHTAREMSSSNQLVAILKEVEIKEYSNEISDDIYKKNLLKRIQWL